MKKIIPVFLLFTLMLQLLPVQQMGYVLFSNQINEELPHGLEDDGKASVKKFTALDDQLLLNGHHGHLVSAFNNSASYISYSCSIPNNHAGEIHTPPPNFFGLPKS